MTVSDCCCQYIFKDMSKVIQTSTQRKVLGIGYKIVKVCLVLDHQLFVVFLSIEF